jgi:hypothetical protein
MTIKESDFYNIINQCKDQVEKHSDIIKLKKNKKKLYEMCDEIIGACLSEL